MAFCINVGGGGSKEPKAEGTCKTHPPERERERLSDHTEDVWSVGPNEREREREREREMCQIMPKTIGPLAPTTKVAPPPIALYFILPCAGFGLGP